MLRPYLLLNLSNYGVGFIASVLFTFSYTGTATQIVITKQVLSSILCLLFVTLPLERALVCDSQQFQPTYSLTQVGWGAGALLGSSIWIGISTGNWLLTAALNIAGSLATLGITVLSTHLMGKGRLSTSLSLTMLSRVMDFPPITLLEYHPDWDGAVFIYYTTFAIFFIFFASRITHLESRRQTIESYEAARIAAMLIELSLVNYLFTHSGDFKTMMFVNALCTIAISLFCVPNWSKISIDGKYFIACGAVVSLISFASPLAGLIIGRLISYFAGVAGLSLSLIIPVSIWISFFLTRDLIALTDAVAISVFSIITSLGGKSAYLMKKMPTR